MEAWRGRVGEPGFRIISAFFFLQRPDKTEGLCTQVRRARNRIHYGAAGVGGTFGREDGHLLTAIGTGGGLDNRWNQTGVLCRIPIDFCFRTSRDACRAWAGLAGGRNVLEPS